MTPTCNIQKTRGRYVQLVMNHAAKIFFIHLPGALKTYSLTVRHI